MRRQTQFGDVVENMDHLIIVVFEWMSGDSCMHVCVCVCVCVCVVCVWCVCGVCVCVVCVCVCVRARVSKDFW